MRVYIFLSLFVSVNSFSCDNATEKYYSWANLKVFPEKVSGQIDKVEAEKREANGDAYYIQLVCDSGDILMLTKRFDSKVFFQIEYLDNSDGIYGKTITNSEGKTTKYVHGKGL
ncbi:hypothetical protein [Teredinibacter purpureus]|uniref:hypothetical protein n=1 Tax=Teredinibacter purpureus TaxID=2731756 RepID=UPI0005F80B28|nr:hypothetical protein [Teredinibacter purpureus]